MTPAIELVQRTNTMHKVHSYEHNPNADSYGDEAVQLLGVNADLVFKTLIVELNNGELAVGVVPVKGKLYLKAIAKALKAKKVDMADTQKAQRVTGYLLGGISPLGQKKALKTVLDVSAQDLDQIHVSAGRRGLEIELNPNDLAKLCRGIFAPIASI